MIKNDLNFKAFPENDVLQDLTELQKWILNAENELEIFELKTKRLARENDYLKKKSAQDEELNANSKVTDLSKKISEQSELILRLQETFAAKEQERYLLERQLYQLLEEGQFEICLSQSQNSNEQAFGVRLKEIQEKLAQISWLLSGHPSEAVFETAPQTSLEVRVALSHRRAFLSQSILGNGVSHAQLPALTSPKGYLFIVTYPYSGGGKLIEKINTRPEYNIRGNICAAIPPLQQIHHALETQATSQAPEQQLRSETLGWAMADSFARNVLKSQNENEVIGAYLRYWGRETDDLFSSLLFINSFFPNAKFLFLTRNSNDVAKFYKQKSSTAWIKNRVKHIDNLFEKFSTLFPNKCHVQNFRKLDSDAETASDLNSFLDSFQRSPTRISLSEVNSNAE